MLDRSVSIGGCVLSREKGIVKILRGATVDAVLTKLVLSLPMLDRQAYKSYGDDNLEPIQPFMTNRSIKARLFHGL
jgi:hypothetical protein